MSRCFPFPPPGYVANGIRDEAMIDSIKGAELKCKKEHKKERKRDKKDKKDKKEKKDKKRKERERGEGESEKHSHKRRRKEEEVAKDDVQKNPKVDVFRKLKESENECFEKSSLTVERELLQSTSQNSCDSTLNSNEKEKQKVKQTTLNGNRQNNNDNTLDNSNELLPKDKEKEKQPLDGNESIIRIRLPIRRPKDPEVMMTNKDQPCPSRDIKLDTTSQSVVTREQPQHLCSTSAPEHASKPHEEKRKHHTSTRKHKDKKLLSTTQETYQPSSLCKFCPPSMAVQFLNVVENWVPSTIESRVSEDDDECWWLTKKPNSHKFDDTERCKQQLGRNNETKQVITSSSLTWPRARLLPEADVYALPYTVPF